MSSIIFFTSLIIYAKMSSMKLSQIKPKTTMRAANRPRPTRLLVDLRAMRQDKGLTLRDIEPRVRVSNGILCQVENGCTPSLETALRIAAFIELPIEKIWALNGKRP